MTKTNNQHNTNANWVVGAVALLLVLLAGILAFYNYWRLHEASEISSTQSEITVDTASVDSATSAGSVPVSSESATGGMVLHTPLPLSNSLDSTVVSTAQAPLDPAGSQIVDLEPEVQKIEQNALAQNSSSVKLQPQNQVPTPLFTGDFQAGQIVEAIGIEDGGVFFCADASAHSVIMNEYQSGDRFTIVPASGEYKASPVENDGMTWYRLVAPDGLVGWMAADTFRAVEEEAQTSEPIPTVMATPAG